MQFSMCILIMSILFTQLRYKLLNSITNVYVMELSVTELSFGCTLLDNVHRVQYFFCQC